MKPPLLVPEGVEPGAAPPAAGRRRAPAPGGPGGGGGAPGGAHQADPGRGGPGVGVVKAQPRLLQGVPGEEHVHEVALAAAVDGLGLGAALLGEGEEAAGGEVAGGGRRLEGGPLPADLLDA